MTSLEKADTYRVAQLNALNSEVGQEYRYRFLAHWMDQVKPNVLTLQEVLDPDAIEASLRPHGFKDFAWAKSVSESGLVDYNGIASGRTLVETHTIEFSNTDKVLKPAVVAAFEIKGGLFYTASAHLMWLMTNEYHRLEQASEISAFASRVAGGANFGENGGDNVFVLGADMNADEDSRTLRYMTGKDVGTSDEDTTQWIDAYTMCSEMMKRSTWATTDQGKNYWGRKMMEKYGVPHPEFVQPRRIDYILSQGWRYGKRGCPVSYGRFGGAQQRAGFDHDLSDHFGIYADILV